MFWCEGELIMPTYEYICSDCNEPFEIFQSMKDDPIEKCPKCTGTVKRLFSSGAGFIFKGSGFYATDYKKKETTAPSQNTNSSACSPACKETKRNENSSPTPTPPSVQQETIPKPACSKEKCSSECSLPKIKKEGK